jgi:hypothetical protein
MFHRESPFGPLNKVLGGCRLIVGPTVGADGTAGPTGAQGAGPQRFGKTGESVVGQAHGKYYEATSRGNVYSVTNGATGQAPGTVLGTHPAILLYNPAGSGKRLKLMKVTGGYISGTLGAGTIFHSGFTLSGTVGGQSGTAPVVGSGAALTPINMDLNAANNSVAVSFANGTLSANPVPLYPFATINAELATTATNPTQLEEDLDGNLVLEPGSGYCLEAIAAAGSTPLMSFGVLWEEVPIV